MHTLHLVRPDGVRLVTPESLRAHVEHGGGAITRETDYRYRPDQGGDGEQGKMTVAFATADGTEVGTVGFSRWLNADGTACFSAIDYHDLRGDDWMFRRGGYIHDDPEGLAVLLGLFEPIPSPY